MTDYITPFWRRYGGWDHTDPATLARFNEGLTDRRRAILRMDYDDLQCYAEDNGGSVPEDYDPDDAALLRAFDDMVKYTRLYKDPTTRRKIPVHEAA